MMTNLFSLSTEAIVEQSSYLASSIFAMVQVAFFPLMIFSFDNYKIITLKVRKRNLAYALLFLTISDIAFALGSGLIGIVCYSLAGGIIMVEANRPFLPSIIKNVPKVFHYVGCSVIHHIMVLILILLVESGLYPIANKVEAIMIIQVSRVIFRMICVVLFHSNKKDWKNPNISLVLNVILNLGEIGFAVLVIWQLGGLKGIIQIPFIIIDCELALALYRQRQNFINSSKTRPDDDKNLKRCSFLKGSSSIIVSSTTTTTADAAAVVLDKSTTDAVNNDISTEEGLNYYYNNEKDDEIDQESVSSSFPKVPDEKPAESDQIIDNLA